MNATNKYLDRCKAALAITSDYALAKALDVQTQRISNYRAERASADPEICIKIAEVLGIPPLTVIADVQREKARDAKTRDLWKKYSSAAAILLATLLSVTSARNAAASAVYDSTNDFLHNPQHSIQRDS